jgi:hypothetical protein
MPGQPQATAQAAPLHMLMCVTVGVRDQALQPTAEAQPLVVAQGAAAALRTRPLPQPTASSLVVESFFFFDVRHRHCRCCQQQESTAPMKPAALAHQRWHMMLMTHAHTTHPPAFWQCRPGWCQWPVRGSGSPPDVEPRSCIEAHGIVQEALLASADEQPAGGPRQVVGEAAGPAGRQGATSGEKPVLRTTRSNESK